LYHSIILMFCKDKEDFRPGVLFCMYNDKLQKNTHKERYFLPNIYLLGHVNYKYPLPHPATICHSVAFLKSVKYQISIVAVKFFHTGISESHSVVWK